MFRTELKFGIIGGLAVCAYKYIEYLPLFQTVRLDSGIYTGLFTYVIVITVIILGVKSKRNNEEDRLLPFRQAFRTGMLIAIFMTLIASPFMFAYAKFINPHEAEQMIKYINANPGDYATPSDAEIYDYYSPRHRAMRMGEDIILTGVLISLFSAGMFRRKPADLDLAKKPKIPSTLKKVFILATVLTLFTLLVYISWLLKYENVTTFLYDFLVDPINPVILQSGTAVLSLMSLVLNVVYYNRISHYRKRYNLWNILMLIFSGILFFIFLWIIL